MNREIFAQRVRDYGQECVLAAMGRASIKDRSVAYEAVLEVFDRICADRDTLAAGVEEYHCRLPAHRDEAVLKAALEVTRRLKAAGEPAKPPAVPAATATGEQKPAEPEPVKPPAMRVWYENGRYFVECEGSVLSLGPKHKDPSAYAIYVPGPATGGPKSAEHAAPAKPEPTQPAAQPTSKMTLSDRLAEMRHEVDGILKRGGSSHITEIINAIHVTARAVDELAKEGKR